MTIKEMQQRFPSIPWVEYINTLLAPDMTVDENEVVIVSVPNYIKDFEVLISKTPKRYIYLINKKIFTNVFHFLKLIQNRS